MLAVFPIDLPAMAPHWKLSSGDYHRMIAAGILREDARIELIGGELIDRAPIGYLHISTVNLINVKPEPTGQGMRHRQHSEPNLARTHS